MLNYNNIYWECPVCGTPYNEPKGEIPNGGKCIRCGGNIVETKYTYGEMLLGNGKLSGGQVIDDIMENYIKPNPQYDPEVYEMWQKNY